MSRPLLDEAIFKYIDAKLSKDGHITTVDVSRAFGLSRQKVSKLFTKYRNEHPINMYRDLHKKCYVKGDDFKAERLRSTSPEEYLNAICIVFGK